MTVEAVWRHCVDTVTMTGDCHRTERGRQLLHNCCTVELQLNEKGGAVDSKWRRL